MSEWTLVIGNKNYSSWSMRGWLVARQAALPFTELVIPLDTAATASAIAAHSPSGKVPVLKHGELVIWDSLAITEYLAEQIPEAGLWPKEEEARAIARAVSSEMHSGFAALRSHMPMNVRARRHGRGQGPGVEEDIRRITAIWRDCRDRFGAGGPFLFGEWCAADAFYAPVASRFHTYGVSLDLTSRVYGDAVLASPLVAEWYAGAAAEPWAIDKYDSI